MVGPRDSWYLQEARLADFAPSGECLHVVMLECAYMGYLVGR